MDNKMIEANKVRHVLAEHLLLNTMEPILDLERSTGCWIEDKRNGDRYLDLYSMYASQGIGYNHPKLVEQMDHLGRVAVHKPSCSDIYTEEMAEFVETFYKIGIPDYLPHAFFIEGGALAVENALKTAFDWKIRKNIAQGDKKKLGTQILHFKEAFHGRSGYTLSLTNTHSPNKTQFFPTFDWPRITNPKAIFPLNQDNLDKIISTEKLAIEEIKEAFRTRGRDIAGLIIEPIQGEGGDNHFRKEFVWQLRDICLENEILLIFDEIQSGIGLTGTFWAHEHFEVEPDIISFGKKSQVCGILAGNRIEEVEEHVFEKPGRIASTWGGNLIDMVRFTYILRIIEEERLVENSRIQGNFLLQQLIELTKEFPGKISNARGMGLMCAMDLQSEKIRDSFVKKMFEKKVMLVGCGKRSVRFRPHLIVTRCELKYGLDIIRNVLETL